MDFPTGHEKVQWLEAHKFMSETRNFSEQDENYDADLSLTGCLKEGLTIFLKDALGCRINLLRLVCAAGSGQMAALIISPVAI